MNCRDIQMACQATDGAPLPDAVQAHLDRCADCREALRRDKAIASLMRLKAHETPDPQVLNRLANDIRRRLRHETASKPSWAAEWLDRWTAPIPVFRYATACLAVVLVVHAPLLARLPTLASVPPEETLEKTTPENRLFDARAEHRAYPPA